MRRLLPAMITVALVSMLPLSTNAQETTAPAEDPRRAEFVETITVPLADGKFDVADVLADLLDEMGIDGSPVRREAWTIDAHGVTPSVVFAMLESTTRGVVDFSVSDDALTMTIDRLQARRESQRLRSEMRARIERWFPRAAAKAMASYGFRVYQPGGVEYRPLDEATIPAEVVVLVHGLDDPTRIWWTLRPILLENGATVCDFQYPNDQRIAESAELFAAELARLRDAGAERISIVAHSMGGLVARDVLTRSTCYAGRGKGHEAYPDVDRFIMIGTPNHGSNLARFHLLSEVRDQVVRTLSGDGMLFGAIFDGAGEAQIDLLPESDFLIELNSRPAIEGVRMTTIAGTMSPVTPARLAMLREALRKTPGVSDPETLIGEVEENLEGISAGLGDGCVPLESCWLERVDDRAIVPGNHLTMIRNFREHDPRTPPAVPIVLDRLGYRNAGGP